MHKGGLQHVRNTPSLNYHSDLWAIKESKPGSLVVLNSRLYMITNDKEFYDLIKLKKKRIMFCTLIGKA